jgi:hypothetical protein
MQEKKIKYGFNIMLPEIMKTIPTLYKEFLTFKKANNINTSPLGKIFTKQPCGDGFVGNGVCPNEECCSIHGWYAHSSFLS